MDRRQLEYFIAIVEHGSFTAASQALRIAQPSLSQAIKALEADLDVQLFTRARSGSHLTNAGEALLGPAQQILRDFDTARGAVSGVANLTGGRLDIACPGGMTCDPLPQLLGMFHRRYPEVAIRVVDPGISDVVTLVRAGESEVALSYFPTVEPDLNADLLPIEAYLVLPPGSPTDRPQRRLSELSEHRLIVGAQYKPVLFRMLAEAEGVTPRIFVETWDRESIILLLLEGLGAALLLGELASMAESLGAVKCRLDPPLVDTAVMYTPRAMSPAAAAFREIALDYQQTSTSG